MKTFSYNVGELKRIIKESSNEFNAVIGPNVKSDNKRNNEKSYKDAEKAARDYDGGLREPSKGSLPQKTDFNRTTLDYNPLTNPDDSYKKRVQAQAKGYTSDLEEKNGIEKGGATFDKDGKILKTFEKSRDERDKEREDLASGGLVGRTMPKESFKKNKLSENMAKRLIFKHTRFLNESNMLQRIPEEYKVDGQKIYMKDGYDNEYIVECAQNSNGIVETNIVSYSNKSLMNEQVDRIFALMNYDTTTNKDERNYHTNLNENQAFNNLLDTSRNNGSVIK